VKEEETFTIDGAYLKHQMWLVWQRYWLPFRPSFWRAFYASKGAKAKFNTWLDWPEQSCDKA
jgi:hypothetical protein